MYLFIFWIVIGWGRNNNTSNSSSNFGFLFRQGRWIHGGRGRMRRFGCSWRQNFFLDRWRPGRAVLREPIICGRSVARELRGTGRTGKRRHASPLETALPRWDSTCNCFFVKVPHNRSAKQCRGWGNETDRGRGSIILSCLDCVRKIFAYLFINGIRYFSDWILLQFLFQESKLHSWLLESQVKMRCQASWSPSSYDYHRPSCHHVECQAAEEVF